MKLPEQGASRADVIARMRERKTADADWRGGRTWSLIYPAGEDVDLLLREAGGTFVTLATGPRRYNQADVLLQPLMAAGPQRLVDAFRERSASR